jgi:hypothetical protein
MPVSNEILNKLEGYEFRTGVEKWLEKFKETPYLSEILSMMLSKYFELPDKEGWITPYRLLKETGIRGKESFYRKSIPNLIEIGVLDFKEVKISQYSQTRRYIKLNDEFIKDVILAIGSFKEKMDNL